MKIERLAARHLHALELQPSQSVFCDVIQQPGYVDAITRAGSAFAAVHDGAVLACAGMVEVWENRAQVWALLSAHAGPHMLGIHRAVDGFLRQASCKRIEAQVLTGFDPGMRWLRRLGFEREGLMRAYAPDGSDYWLFARVR